MKKKKLMGTDYLLSVQHLFAMFGATVLVPLLTGLNTSTALVSAGIGTLIFHLCTKFKVPVFLGSSFAFIPAIAAITMQNGHVVPSQIPIAQGGIMAAGLVYLLFALIVFAAGPDRVKKLFPPVVTGPVIITIGISLASTAINDASGWADFTHPLSAATYANIGIAVFTLAIVIICSILEKGFFKLVPILIGIASGYVLCLILSALGVYHMDLSPIANASWINIPFVTQDANKVGFVTLPQLNWGAVLSIAPIAIVSFMEHIGDITTNGAVVGQDFIKEPGLHRTLMGDGLATAFAGLVGGPPNTTYSENTGVLATTKNYNPRLLRVTAVIAIALGFLGKFGAILQTIPGPVKGGVEIMLFGMIAAIGIRTLVDANLDFTYSRNLIITGIILVIGLGVGAVGGIIVPIGGTSILLSGLFLAVIFGVIVNLVLPQGEES
ncbi:MAG: uracil-xanthine permease [Coriobacteriia bacterium]|nr:uracil-xanthine permease [Coriobacteriia bacterium]